MAHITSRPLGTTSEAGRKSKSIHWDRLPIVFLGLIIMFIWWAAGARWTIDGLPLLINEILKFFHIPAQLAPLTDPAWYVLLFWLPIAISFAEHKYAPWRSLKWSLIMVYVIGVWLVVSGLDLGSTYLALIHPGPDDWLIARQLATIKPLAAAWGILTTFAPEIGMSVLWWWLRE